MEEKLPSWRWAIVSVVCLLCFMANYMQYQVSALAVEVMPMLNIDTVGFSMLFLVPMLTAVFFSIPLGALGDRIGSKKVVTVCTAISVAGGFLRCFTLDSFTMQMTSMFLIGMGISALNANLIKVLGTWFREQTGFAMGLFYAASCVAIVVAQICAGLFGSVFNSSGSAGGIVGTISLLMSYFLPIGISAIAGADYTMNMGLESLCFLLSVVPVFFLPELGRKAMQAAAAKDGE